VRQRTPIDSRIEIPCIRNMFMLLKREDGSPILIAGPCWAFCMFITLPLILSLSGLVAYFVIQRENDNLVRSFFLFQIRKLL